MPFQYQHFPPDFNIKTLGILDAVCKYTEQTFSSAPPAPTPCLQRHFGNVSLAQHGTPTSVAHKNNILNIDFCRDLLMEDFQQQIRQLLKTFDYEYLTLDCFLADDLQIYFSDNLNADFTIKE